MVTDETAANLLYNQLRSLIDAIDTGDALLIENAINEAEALLYDIDT